jgi:hypothetical protein
MKESNPRYSDPAYVQGTVDAIHATILALASSAGAPNPDYTEARRSVLSMDVFHDAALARLEAIRDELTADGAAPARIDAVDDAIRWIHKVTAG